MTCFCSPKECCAQRQHMKTDEAGTAQKLSTVQARARDVAVGGSGATSISIYDLICS